MAGGHRIPIIPVLLDECEVPTLISQLSAIKIYEGMEVALSKLLSALELVDMDLRPRNTITEYTIDFLEDLKDLITSTPLT